MGRVVKHEQCPRCANRGADRHGDNLGIYSDGSSYCFSCGYHKPATFKLKYLMQKENVNDEEKALLPSDFTREVPTEGWKWLLKYGLPYSYWKTYCGYSPKENRLVFTVGTPTRFSIGRSLSVGKSKWKIYGDKSSYIEIVGDKISREIILVEDIISAHKIGSSGYMSIPLFGTTIHDNVVKKLQELKQPVALWLDEDQYSLLPKKINRLQTLLGLPVRHITTRKDPKEYTSSEIKEILV